MSRVKAIYRSWGIACAGKQGLCTALSLGMAREDSRSRSAPRAEFYYQQFDALRSLRQDRAARAVDRGPEARRLEIATRDSVHRPDPGGAADRFDPDTAPVPYQATAAGPTAGFEIETYSSAEHRYVQGELKRAKKPASIRGLNRNHNHDLKNLFKSAATVAAAEPGTVPGVLRTFSGQGNSAGDGPPDPGAQNCSHHVDPLEERRALRRPPSETTNSLSVSSESVPSLGSLLVVASSGSRDTRVRGRVSAD